MLSINFFIAVLVTLISLTAAQDGHNDASPYTLTDDLSYKNFFDGFDFYDGPDPTKGFVKYQNQEYAIKQYLVGYLEDTQSVFMGVDHTTKDTAGRASVRLESKKSWNHGLMIADIRHMPSSECGPWPAMWLLSSSDEWPMGGEIDILEGVNDYTSNSVTLHTSKGCIVDNSTSGAATGGTSMADAPFSGTMSTDDCDVKAPGQGENVGCSIHAPDSMSGVQMGGTDNTAIPVATYGTDFNKAGGGIYATEWTEKSISVWFFPRDSPAFTQHFGASQNTSTGTTSPDPSTWGPPIAHFAGTGCDFTSRFKDLKIIFNTAFCGDWAGKEWEKGGCAKKTGVATCDAYVRDNPQAFPEAYWEVAGLKWFQKTAPAKLEAAIRPPVINIKSKGRRYAW